MAKVKRKDDRDSLESEIEGNLRTIRRRGFVNPKVDDLRALLEVGRALSDASTNYERIEAALSLAIEDYHDAHKVETMHLWFGLHPKTLDTTKMGATKRTTAAWEYAIANDPTEKRAEQGFRTHGGDDRFRILAEHLHLRYKAAPKGGVTKESAAPPKAPQAPQPEPALTLEVPPPLAQASDMPSIRRWLLVCLLLGSVVLVLVLTITGAWSSAPASAPLPSLVRLGAESNRHLVGSQAPAPDMGSTRQMGFGDPSPNGRTTYRNVRQGSAQGYVAPTSPTFDSVVNGLVEPNNELKFLNVQASRLTDGRQVDHYGRVALARPKDLIWLNIFIDNNAQAAPHCELTGPFVATGARLELRIWNSPDERLHIIRAWVTAANTTPRWITDAVAVVTTQSTTLELDSAISRESSGVTGRFADDPVTNVETAMLYPGLLLDGDGTIGSCYDEVVELDLALHQAH